MKQFGFAVVVFLSIFSICSAASDFDDLTLAAESYYNGSDGAGGFTSGDAEFNNFYDDTYGPYWEGFAYSNTTDTTTAGIGNQYSAITGEGAAGSQNYAVGYVGFMGTTPEITLDTPGTVNGVYITNTTYAYLSMRDGDSFAKQFGGASGDDPDYFKLIITGLDASDTPVGTVQFYLADFQSDDNSLDYILDKWTWVDLSPLGTVAKLKFSFESSDVGAYGINTPTYFAMDGTETTVTPGGNGGGGSSSGCFISSARMSGPGTGLMVVMMALLSGGLCVLGVKQK